METEQKIIRFFDTEMRASENEDMEVEGYALKFEKETVIGSSYWGWREKILRTALDGTKMDDVVFNFNHSMSDVLSGTRNGSMQLIVDSVGLKISAKIIDTAIGRDVYKLIKESLINRMSFAAIVKKSKWTYTEDGSEEMDLREIIEFSKFYDVSAVTFPAYDDTPLATRGLKSEIETRKQEIKERQLQKQARSQIKRLDTINYQRQMQQIKRILGGI